MGFFDDIKKKAEGLVDDAKNKIAEIDLEDVKRLGSELTDGLSEGVDNLKEKGSQTFAEASQNISNFAEVSSQRLTEIQESSSQKLAEIADASAQKLVELKASSSELYDKASDVASEASQKIGDAVSAGVEKVSSVTLEDVSDTAVRGAKLVSGVQAYTDRKESIALMDQANALKEEVEKENEKRRMEFNLILEDFGQVR